MNDELVLTLFAITLISAEKRREEITTEEAREEATDEVTTDNVINGRFPPRATKPLKPLTRNRY